ncbi:hypothetical protein Salat_0272000 [Sesamum alatum]|uniref:Bifunctional inhibitor/plant lipid transfer protein/seed storage helical domain-containing protein n=1 Tax=Sesamum alatum TaxID=300844 RepID=A0AAE2CYK2_9LAMI|nr:hypothetical protein Salat_0272000 [Sesamum alatum]
MARCISTCLAGILVLVLISSPARLHAFSCTEALTDLLPCRSFLTGNAPITVSCCRSVDALRQAAAAQSDKRAICRCLKQAALSANVNQRRVQGLENGCKISIPFPIDPNFNCGVIPRYTPGPPSLAYSQ